MTASGNVLTLSRPRPRSTAVIDLYCFPYAGGGPSAFRHWTSLLPDAVRVHVVCYPTAGPRRSIIEIARRAADNLVHREAPYAFFGHSMGALVAFEVARELRRRARAEPRCLLVSGHAAPHLPPVRAPIHALPSEDFWLQVESLGGIPPEIVRHEELRGLREHALRADFAACETYEYQPDHPLTCDLVAYAGADDREAPPATVASWRMHTLGTFTSRVLPGGHFFIEEQRTRLLADLADRLSI